MKVDVRLKGDAAVATPLLSANVQVDVDAKVSLAVVGHVKVNADVDVEASTKLQLVTLASAAVDAQVVKLRVLHASPSAPLLDVAANAKLVARAVAFAKVSDYVKLDADLAVGAKLGLRLGGLNVDAAIAATLLFHAKGSVLTAIALGEILPTCDDDKFLTISILNELTGELSHLNLEIDVNGPKASFYLFHAGLDLGTIDLALKSGAVLHANLGYLKASSILQVNAGVLAVELRLAGTLSAALSVNLKLLPGTHWTLCANGLLNFGARVAAKLNLSAAVRLGANIGAHARLFNAVCDVAAIDVHAGLEVWAKALLFAKAGAYVKLLAGLSLLPLNVKASASVQALISAAIDPVILNLCKDQVVTYFVVGAADLSLSKPLTVVAGVESDLTLQPLNCLPLPKI